MHALPGGIIDATGRPPVPPAPPPDSSGKVAVIYIAGWLVVGFM
jgi:hypothetical protein